MRTIKTYIKKGRPFIMRYPINQSGLWNFCQFRRIRRQKSRASLLGAILVQKSENVIGPAIGSKVAKGVAVSRGVAVGGINLQFVRLAHLAHLCRESLARRQVKIISGLKKEDWRFCISHGTSHKGP